ncbi:MAG: hypothetical protein R3D33_00490 [Hyphomicrobiaceae bacterium]
MTGRQADEASTVSTRDIEPLASTRPGAADSPAVSPSPVDPVDLGQEPSYRSQSCPSSVPVAAERDERRRLLPSPERDKRPFHVAVDDGRLDASEDGGSARAVTWLAVGARRNDALAFEIGES